MDAQCVVQGLHAGRVLGELVVPEVGLAHTDGDNQIVVREGNGSPIGPTGVDQPGLGIHVRGLGEKAAHVVVASKDRTQRLRDLAFGQNPGGALVQQRLEEVVGTAVDHGHRDR